MARCAHLREREAPSEERRKVAVQRRRLELVREEHDVRDVRFGVSAGVNEAIAILTRGRKRTSPGAAVHGRRSTGQTRVLRGRRGRTPLLEVCVEVRGVELAHDIGRRAVQELRKKERDRREADLAIEAERSGPAVARGEQHGQLPWVDVELVQHGLRRLVHLDAALGGLKSPAVRSNATPISGYSWGTHGVLTGYSKA